MTLNQKQRDTAAKEFASALTKLQLTSEKVASDLQTPVNHLTEILQLKDQASTPENVWIVRNYFLEKEPALTFSVLTLDYHDLWFLDSEKIDRKEIQ